MWQRLTKPDVLVFLQASCASGAKRRKLNWTAAEWDEQQRMLEHARGHSDLLVQTDGLESEEVLGVVLEFLRKKGIINRP